MGRAKDDYIEKTGGFSFDTNSQSRADELEKQLFVDTGETFESKVERIRELRGLPSDEWDYEPKD